MFITAHRIQLQDEVATLCPHNGGVGIQLEQYAHVARIIGLLAVLDIQRIEASTDVVGLFHIRVDVQTAVGAYRQLFIHESHSEEIGFLEVGTDRTFYLLRVEQHVDRHVPIEDLIMTCQTGLRASISERRGGCQVVEVHIAVFQQSYVGIRLQTTLF